MPPYLAEIPYGFKNIWIITVAQYDLQNRTFQASDIQEVFLNGSTVQPNQLKVLYDYNRDGCSMTQTGAETGIYVTLTGFNKEIETYGFQPLISQSLNILGVTSVQGDMVDNTNVLQPYINHDDEKLDVLQYEADKVETDIRLETAERNIGNNANSITDLRNTTITGIILNDVDVPISDGVANIEIAALTPEQLEARLLTKVDKTVAGAGGTIVKSTENLFDTLSRTMTFNKTLLSLETGATENKTTSYNLADLLGITDLEAIDKELFYFCDDTHITSINTSVDILLENLYRISPDGSRYIPTTTENIQLIFGVAVDYSGFNQPEKRFVGCIGRMISATETSVKCSFINLQQYSIYNRYNGYRTGAVVLDTSTNSLYRTIQAVPTPTAESNIVPISNELYYSPIKDVVPMPSNTVWANFEATAAPGKAYSNEDTRIKLINESSGYDNYISFLTDIVPSQILTNEDWNTYIQLWVTDGIQFSSRMDLINYLNNFNEPTRYVISNRGILELSYESGEITIAPVFTLDTINPMLGNMYQMVQPDAISGDISVFDDAGKLTDSGKSLSDLATSTQGAKADTAVQSVQLATGATNGTVQLTVDGDTQSASVAGLGTAAFSNSSAYATAEQGTKADSALQTAMLSPGDENGTIALNTNGVIQTPVSVKGLGTAAYTNTTNYATAEQGVKADSAVQSVTITTGTSNGTFDYSVNGGTASPVSVFGLRSAAYTPASDYATVAQGTRADSALQPSSVVDNLTSTATHVPLSANQGRVLEQLIQSLSPEGKYIGGFETYADVYTNTSQYPADLQPINVNDTIYIASDEFHTDQPAQYRVSVIGDDGTITYSFIRIAPDVARDFTITPIQTNEIASGAVTSDTIQNGAIITEDIADNAVTEDKLDIDTQSKLSKATNSLQSGTVSSGLGNIVTSVTENEDKTLTVNYTDSPITVLTTGTGDFLTNASINGPQLILTKSGTAVKTVSKLGTGNFLTNAILTDKNIEFSTGTALTSINTTGTGNVVTNISAAGTATMGTAITSITKSGTGNVITGVSTTGGATTLTSGNAVMSATTSGTGNVVTGVSVSDGILTATKGTVVASLPDASTTQKGVVQLNNTLTSTSTSQALTAAQGNILATNMSASDSQNVKLTGNQTISGTKTFSTHPVVPSKTTLSTTPSATSCATEAQVSTRIAKPSNSVLNNIAVYDGTGGLIDSGVAYTKIDEISASIDTKLSGYVPVTRTVNNKALSSDVVLTSTDVGADASGTAQSLVTAHANNAAIHVSTSDRTNWNGKAKAYVFTATLRATAWGNIIPYTQTVSVTGITSSMQPIMGLVESSDITTAIQENEEFSKLSANFETGNGTITVRCLESKPTINLNVIIKEVI